MSNPEKGYKELYTAANELMAKVGCDGEIEINTMDNLVCNIMDALFEIDGGSFDNEAYGYIEVETKYMGESQQPNQAQLITGDEE